MGTQLEAPREKGKQCKVEPALIFGVGGKTWESSAVSLQCARPEVECYILGDGSSGGLGGTVACGRDMFCICLGFGL